MFQAKQKYRRFEKKIWLSSPTMHGEELRYMKRAYETNWMSTVGENIDELERGIAEKVGRKYAVCLSSGTAALHLAMKLAGVKRGDKVEGVCLNKWVNEQKQIYRGKRTGKILTEKQIRLLEENGIKWESSVRKN